MTRLINALYAHARFVDLDLDARPQWVGKVKKNQRCMLSATKQSISIKLTKIVGRYLCDLDLDFADIYKYGLSILFSHFSDT